jgi:protein-disulfide isomerase
MRYALGLLAGALAFVAAAGSALALGDADKAEVRTIIREYLIENPEVIREAIEALETRQKEAEAKSRAVALEEKKTAIYDSKHQVELGNRQGDVTLVEFFDYNCGYCKRALEDMNVLLGRDPKLRVVLKEFPVLGQGSADAAAIAVAVNMQAPQSYLEFHRRLLGVRGAIGKDQALAVAKQLGLDIARLEKDAASPEAKANLGEVYEIARALGLNGTPSYIIGDEIVPGAIGAEELAQRIASVRQCGKTTC